MVTISHYREKITFENRQEVWLYYDYETLATLAELEIYREVGKAVKIKVNDENISSFGLYFLYIDKSKDDIYGGKHNQSVFSEAIIKQIFHGLGAGIDVPEWQGTPDKNREKLLPIKFTKDNYLKIKKKMRL